MPDSLHMFLPFSKIDVENRTVYGMATGEERDLTDEVCDYESTKPLYVAWSEKMRKTSGGKSLGNVRAMHGKTAAGKVTDISYDDVGKRIMIAAKVVDDAEWEKVEEGVYTGFSQGGKYVKRWLDPKTGFLRYTADPHEVSLVDMPCLPGATFEMIKSAGVSEKVQFTNLVAEPAPEAIQARAETLAKGVEGKTWNDFVELAAADLKRAEMASALAEKSSIADPDPGNSDGTEVTAVSDANVAQVAHITGDRAPPEAPRPGEITRKWVEPKQVWACGEHGPYFDKKADAVAKMKLMDQLEVGKSASPLSGILAEIEKKVGIATEAEPDPISLALERLFPSVAKRTFSADDRKAAAKAGTAMPDGSFPIENKEDLANAIKLYPKAKDKVAARAHIEARAKALGATDSLPETWATKAAEAGDLAKGMWGVTDLAQTIASLAGCYRDALDERAYEGDSSTVPDDLCHLLRSAGEALLRMVAEELGELMPDGAEPTLEQMDIIANAAGLTAAGAAALVKLSKAEGAFAPLAKFDGWLGDVTKSILADLEKIGRRNSKADQKALQGIHDHSMSLGATCSKDNCGKDAASEDDLLKAANARIEALEKDAKEAGPRFEGIVKTLTDRLAKVEAQPAPAKARVTVVERGVTGGGSEGPSDAELLEKFQKMSDEQKALVLMKGALARPIPMIPVGAV